MHTIIYLLVFLYLYSYLSAIACNFFNLIYTMILIKKLIINLVWFYIDTIHFIKECGFYLDFIIGAATYCATKFVTEALRK